MKWLEHRAIGDVTVVWSLYAYMIHDAIMFVHVHVYFFIHIYIYVYVYGSSVTLEEPLKMRHEMETLSTVHWFISLTNCQ